MAIVGALLQTLAKYYFVWFAMTFILFTLLFMVLFFMGGEGLAFIKSNLWRRPILFEVRDDNSIELTAPKYSLGFLLTKFGRHRVFPETTYRIGRFPAFFALEKYGQTIRAEWAKMATDLGHKLNINSVGDAEDRFTKKMETVFKEKCKVALRTQNSEELSEGEVQKILKEIEKSNTPFITVRDHISPEARDDLRKWDIEYSKHGTINFNKWQTWFKKMINASSMRAREEYVKAEMRAQMDWTPAKTLGFATVIIALMIAGGVAWTMVKSGTGQTAVSGVRSSVGMGGMAVQLWRRKNPSTDCSETTPHS